MVHQKESKAVIRHTQTVIKENPRLGFWMISAAAFFLSPFLTNDGVCLLFVEPILNAFESVEDSVMGRSISGFDLRRSDSVFFLLALACSSNIGSALTYTGNPQVSVQTGSIIYKFILMPPHTMTTGHACGLTITHSYWNHCCCGHVDRI